MSGGQQPVTQQTTQTRDPWIGAQGALGQVQGAASNLYNTNTGYAPYSGQTQATLSPQSQTSLDQMYAMTQQGQPSVDASLGLANQQIGNYGLSPEMQSLYGQISTQQNPFLQDILNTSNRRIGDRVNAAMSGAGRYGSGQHTDVMTRALAESADPILAQDYAQRQQQREQILTGGLQRAGQFAQLAPTLEQARYAPQERGFGLGQFLDSRAQAQLNDQIKLYNAQQSWPWEQLARYSGIASGAGGLGGTQVTTSPLQQPTSLQSALGGAAAGAGIGSIFGPAGTAVGGLGGGLLGLLR